MSRIKLQVTSGPKSRDSIKIDKMSMKDKLGPSATLTLSQGVAQEMWRVAADKRITIEEFVQRLIKEVMNEREEQERAKRNIVKFPLPDKARSHAA